MLEHLDLPIAKTDGLSTAELNTIQEQLTRAEAQVKARKDALFAIFERRFSAAVADEYKSAGKDTGTVRLAAPGSNLLELKVERDKTVVWDQEKTLKVLNGMKPEDARHYGKIKVEIPEAKYTAAPPDVQKLLTPLRSVKAGKNKYTLVQREVPAETSEAA